MAQLVTPYNTDEFYAMHRAAVTLFKDRHDELHTIAVDLRQLLANPRGTKLRAMRVDLKLNAIRVARHIEHAAGAQLAAAKAVTNGYRTYVDLYTNQDSAASRGRQFTVN